MRRTAAAAVLIAAACGMPRADAAPPSGSVVAWGYGAAVAKAPRGLTDIVAIAAGNAHAVALRTNGTLVAWGASWGAPQTQVPKGLRAVSIAAGNDFSVAATPEGRVVVWGRGADKHLRPPGDLGVAVQVAAGDQHILALLEDGTVRAWGDNAVGQADVPADLRDVRTVAAGTMQSFAIRTDGRVVRWGCSARCSGLLYNAAPSEEIQPHKDIGSFDNAVLNALGAKATSLGSDELQTVLVRPDGSLVAECHWENPACHVPPEVVSLRDVTAVAAGAEHSLALRRDRTVVSWGLSASELAVPADLHGVVAVAASNWYSLAIVSR